MGKKIRPRPLAQEIDDGLSRRDEAAHPAAERLAECPRHDVDAASGQRGRALAARPKMPGRVTIVDQNERVVAIGKGADLLMVDVALDIRDLVLRLEAERIHVPLVACGTQTDARAAVAAIHAGAKEYIPLPPDPEMIAAVLAAVADDIAYDAHDIDDGLRAELFSLDDIGAVELAGKIIGNVRSAHPNLDDSRVVRKVARRILEANGCTVEEAADGQQALDACRAGLPDFVLLDWNMPVMDGLTFLRALRVEFGPDVPVIFCTTENDMAHIEEAIANGAREYIMKPFDEEILVGKLGQAGVL